VPAGLCRNEQSALQALREKQLPLVLPKRELPVLGLFEDYEPRLTCSSFVEARMALNNGNLATILPDFLKPEKEGRFQCLRVPGVTTMTFRYRLAWNPRLLRLNPHAIRRREFLYEALMKQMQA
jgi:DNA-binding transcriptional LysR family regulator